MTPRASSLITLAIAACATIACVSAQPPAPRPSNFAEAKSLLGQHRLAEAETEALTQLKLHPTSVEGQNLLGIIEANRRNFDGALEAFEKALRLAPASTETHNNLGNIYAVQSRFDLAEKEFRAVLRVDPANRDANYNLGMLLMARNAPAEAIPHLLRVRPQTSETRFSLIRAYLHTKRAPEALHLAGELSDQSKDDVKVHFTLGTLLASEKQYEAAARELEKADALQPDTFEILFNLGQTELRANRNPEAALVLNRALKLRPESADTLYLLAQAAMNQSRPLDALDLALRAHRIAPENADVIFLMALVSMSQNYFEDAIPLLESGLKIAPRRADLLAALGESYFMAGKVDKAGEEFQKLVELEGSARSYAFLGLSFRNLGRFDDAKKNFQQGLKLDPRNISCLFNLGFIAERQGDAAGAEAMLQRALAINPKYPDALIELANLRSAGGKPAEAVDLLRKFVQVSGDPAPGYYRLAMIERTLHRTADAERDLNSFKTLNKDTSSGPIPYEHLFDYLDTRSRLAPGAKVQLDLADLTAEAARHPDRPETLYMLTEADLKAGDLTNARSAITRLDAASAGDFRTLTGVGVLLARYRLYDDAIQHFNSALALNPASDEVQFDLANAYFKKRLYPQALEAAQKISPAGSNDDATLALLGDIYAHLGDAAHAGQIFNAAIERNPDNDQSYLSLALSQLRGNDVAGARKTLLKCQARVPASGKMLWGLGLVDALDGNTVQATKDLEHAVDLLPEWPGGYSTLGVFYFETGQIAKAREVLNRFKNSSASGSLDIDRISQVLDRAPETEPAPDAPMPMEKRAQLLQLALSLADRTL